eukprot:UN08314
MKEYSKINILKRFSKNSKPSMHTGSNGEDVLSKGWGTIRKFL